MRKGNDNISLRSLIEGTVVDPDSGFEDETHVYTNGKLQFYAVSGRVDIVEDKNSYYKIQLLESDDLDRYHLISTISVCFVYIYFIFIRRYWVFRSWGRVSTRIGGNALDSFHSLKDALISFETHYEEKTGNIFGQEFVKKPGRYYHMDINYGREEELDENKLEVDSDIKSKLPEKVQELVKILFDINLMKQFLYEFELDMEKMPLGKISLKQIQKAWSVLNEIAGLIEKGAEQSGNRLWFLEKRP